MTLSVACAQKHTEIVRLLLERPECDVNRDMTLRIACDNNHTEIVRLLLERPECDVSCVYTRYLGVFDSFNSYCSFDNKKLILEHLRKLEKVSTKKGKFEYELLIANPKYKDE